MEEKKRKRKKHKSIVTTWCSSWLNFMLIQFICSFQSLAVILLMSLCGTVWKDSGWSLQHTKGQLESFHHRDGLKHKILHLPSCPDYFWEKGKKKELKMGRPGRCFDDRLSEQCFSVREVSSPRPNLQLAPAWLPHLAVEWQDVRCDPSRGKVRSGGTHISNWASLREPVLPSLPLVLSSSTVWQKQSCEECRLS